MQHFLSILFLFWVNFSYSQSDSAHFYEDSNGIKFVQLPTGEVSPFVKGHYVIYRDSIFSIYDASHLITFSGSFLQLNIEEYEKFLRTSSGVADKELILRVIEMADPGRCYNIGSHDQLNHLLSKTVVENTESLIWFLNQPDITD